jgi:hypothetical protein
MPTVPYSSGLVPGTGIRGVPVPLSRGATVDISTIGPSDFTRITHSLLHAGSHSDDDSENNSEEEVDVYDVGMDEYVPSYSVTTKNKWIPAIYKVNLLC